jgi:hypothetical protein
MAVGSRRWLLGVLAACATLGALQHVSLLKASQNIDGRVPGGGWA